jgi:hypothetical protein
MRVFRCKKSILHIPPGGAAILFHPESGVFYVRRDDKERTEATDCADAAVLKLKKVREYELRATRGKRLLPRNDYGVGAVSFSLEEIVAVADLWPDGGSEPLPLPVVVEMILRSTCRELEAARSGLPLTVKWEPRRDSDGMNKAVGELLRPYCSLLTPYVKDLSFYEAPRSVVNGCMLVAVDVKARARHAKKAERLLCWVDVRDVLSGANHLIELYHRCWMEIHAYHESSSVDTPCFTQVQVFQYNRAAHGRRFMKGS